MDALNVTRSEAELSDDDDCSNSAEYLTVSVDSNNEHANNEEDEELTTAATDFKTFSADGGGGGCNRDDQHTSMSDYRTLSPDCDSQNERSAAVNDEKKFGYACPICLRRFKTLQECFRHDLFEHKHERIQGKNTRKLKAMLLILKEGEQQEQADRAHVHRILANCQPGLELQELFKNYCISDEGAELIGWSIWSSLQQALVPINNLSIQGYGSILNGLMTLDSDVDIFITINEDPNKRSQAHPNHFALNKSTGQFNRINSWLRRCSMFAEIITIRKARVPIIKCLHKATNTNIDINTSCPHSVFNSQFLKWLLKFDVRLRSLMLFIKIWAKQMKLIRNGITSYCLTMLVLFYLQQQRPNNQDQRPAIVPAIKQLQANLIPKYVEGVNYAYDLGRLTPMPLDVTTHDLIKGFFTFYRYFDFTENMVAPYLAKAISLADMRTGKFNYTDYQMQLNQMREHAKELYEVHELHLERCMVVQDAFQLNHNVSKGVGSDHLDYFRMCIEHAYNTCMQPDIKTNAELYERLLFDVINQIRADVRALWESAGQRMPQPQSSIGSTNELTFSLTPSSAEKRALAQYILTNNTTDDTLRSPNYYKEWLRHYIEAIYAILVFVFRLQVKLYNTAQNCVVDEESTVLAHQHSPTTAHATELIMPNWWKILNEEGELIWHISGSLDLWSDRMYNRKNATSFMDCQLKQTENFLSERSNCKAYVVNIKGIMHIKPSDSFKSFELSLTPDTKDGKRSSARLPKKEPLRKFFSCFKNSMQNFNLKDKLQAESGRKQIPQSQDQNIWKKRPT